MRYQLFPCHSVGNKYYNEAAFLPVVWGASGRPGARCQSGSQTGRTLLLPWQCHSSVNIKYKEKVKQRGQRFSMPILYAQPPIYKHASRSEVITPKTTRQGRFVYSS